MKHLHHQKKKKKKRKKGRKEKSPGEGNCNPLWYSCLENSTDRGAWEAAVPGVTKSQT